MVLRDCWFYLLAAKHTLSHLERRVASTAIAHNSEAVALLETVATMSDEAAINCYDFPQYWDLAFSDETLFEADFIEAAADRYSGMPVSRMYEPGCGAGRLVIELARRGYHLTACDLSSASVEYVRQRLLAATLTADVACDDMTSFVPASPVDVAFNTVNTFRHLLTEDAAQTHLMTVAGALRAGGLYIIGLHLLPPDADEEDSESWSITEGDVTVDVTLDVLSFSRETRVEELHFRLDVNDGGSRYQLATTYPMRIYRADQITQLLATVPEFELCDVFDFNYEIDEPLRLSDELGDTVLVLRKRR